MGNIISNVTWRSLSVEQRRATRVEGQVELELGELIQLASARAQRAQRVRLDAAPVTRASDGSVPARHRQRWSDDEEAWLQQRLDEDADYATVAAELGRTRRACFQRAYLKTMVVGSDTCLHCSKEMQQPAVGPKRTFCSELCSRHHLHPRAQVSALLNCPHCRVPFVPAHSRQLYCSRVCSTAASHERHLRDVTETQRLAGGVSITAGKPLVGQAATSVIVLHERGHSLREICRLTGYGFRQVRSCVVSASTPKARSQEDVQDGMVSTPLP